MKQEHRVYLGKLLKQRIKKINDVEVRDFFGIYDDHIPKERKIIDEIKRELLNL